MAYTCCSAVIAALLARWCGPGTSKSVCYFFAARRGSWNSRRPIRSLLVFDTVGPDEMTNAVALNALGGNAMRVIGPASAGHSSRSSARRDVRVQALCLAGACCLRLASSSPPDRGDNTEGVFRVWPPVCNTSFETEGWRSSSRWRYFPVCWSIPT